MSLDLEKVQHDIRKGLTHKGRLILKGREARTVEGPKSTLVIRGNKTSDIVNQALKDLYSLKKDYSVFYNQKHEIHPFEDTQLLEKYSQKTNASLFILGYNQIKIHTVINFFLGENNLNSNSNNQKKRPNNLVIGRLFEHRVLDFVELGIDKFRAAQAKVVGVPLHVRPAIVFQGDVFDYNPTFMKIKNLFLDIFSENVHIPHIDIMNGIVCAVVITAAEGEKDRFYMRTYNVHYSQASVSENVDANGNGESQHKLLTDIGPSFDFVVRREKWADEAIFRAACKRPKEYKKKENKNVVRDTLGDKRGHVFVDKQNLDQLALRKRKKIQEKQDKKIENIEKEMEVDI